MKEIFSLYTIFFTFSQIVLAQNVPVIEIKNNDQKVIFLELDDKNKIDIFNDKDAKDARRKTDSKANSINIYIKWLNPLKYKLTWKDTILVDERDKKITDFTDLLVPQFGKPVTDLNTPNGMLPKSLGSTDSTEITGRNYNDKELLLFLIHLRTNQRYLDKSEIFNINQLTESLKELDDLDAFNVHKAAANMYKGLFDLKDIADYDKNFLKQKDTLRIVETKFVDIEAKRSNISEKLKTFRVKDEMLNSYLQASISGFLSKTLSNLNTNKNIITKLKTVFDIVENSTLKRSSIEKNKDSRYERSAEFDNGKKLETTLVISEYKFNETTLEYSKDKDVVTSNFIFRKYEIVDVFVSAGIFYSNTTLKGFGITNDGNGKFIVTEDNIQKDEPVAALFLNLDFKLSRYFSPLLQIGIDPTKRRPFLLFGPGFSIPAARIAFSGGLIWAWDQELENLSVGSTIDSSTDLEKATKYKFKADPKGWYLGIQYRF